MDVGVYGYKGLWVYECMGVGFMDVGVYGFMGVEVYGYTGLWV